MAGKAPVFLANGNLYDDTAEVIQLTYGKNVKLAAIGGKLLKKIPVIWQIRPMAPVYLVKSAAWI